MIVDRVHSLEMSAKWSVLARRPVVIAVVKIRCLQDSVLYRECHVQ